MRTTFDLTMHEVLIVTATVALIAAVVAPRVLVPRARAAPVRVMMPPPPQFEINSPGVIFYTTGTTLVLDTSTAVLPDGGSIPHAK